MGTPHGMYCIQLSLALDNYSVPIADEEMVYILTSYVGLSALLVSTNRAMRRPSECEASDKAGSTFFCM